MSRSTGKVVPASIWAMASRRWESTAIRSSWRNATCTVGADLARGDGRLGELEVPPGDGHRRPDGVGGVAEEVVLPLDHLLLVGRHLLERGLRRRAPTGVPHHREQKGRHQDDLGQLGAVDVSLLVVEEEDPSGGQRHQRGDHGRGSGRPHAEAVDDREHEEEQVVGDGLEAGTGDHQQHHRRREDGHPEVDEQTATCEVPKTVPQPPRCCRLNRSGAHSRRCAPSGSGCPAASDAGGRRTRRRRSSPGRRSSPTPPTAAPPESTPAGCGA